MAIKVAINGFGRIGRNVLRQLFSTNTRSDLKVVAINDLTDAPTLAHLMKYDSVHGIFPGEVSAHEGAISVCGTEIKILAEKDPKNLPWKTLGVDIVLECTGIFTKKEKASIHLQAGARKVIISAPSPDPDITIAYGVNHEAYNPATHSIVSCASCTTNCLAPVAKVVLENFGVVRGAMTTIHSYTNDQRILDLPHKDLRRARAAALSMIPTTTGAAKAVGLVLPKLVGKIDGFAVRVPTPNVSLTDFVVEVEKETSVESVNNALRSASEGSLKGILSFCTEPLVSCDFRGSAFSSIVDSQCTMVVDKKLVKVIAWYDNEQGFSARMIDVMSLMGRGLV
jgi:glyceraldehyde 3-phosphate dehydrogenase